MASHSQIPPEHVQRNFPFVSLFPLNMNGKTEIRHYISVKKCQKQLTILEEGRFNLMCIGLLQVHTMEASGPGYSSRGSWREEQLYESERFSIDHVWNESLETQRLRLLSDPSEGPSATLNRGVRSG